MLGAPAGHRAILGGVSLPPVDRAETPSAERRVTLAVGVLLVVVGAGFLLARQAGIDLGSAGWPLFVIIPGLILFGVAFAVGGRKGSGFAVAGGVVTMTGLLLAFQNATGLWATWAYAWALVAPGGVGLGLLLYALLTGQREFVRPGGETLLAGLGLFLGFAFFFEAVIGLSGPQVGGLDGILAGGLVVLGAVLLVLGLRGGPRRTS